MVAEPVVDRLSTPPAVPEIVPVVDKLPLSVTCKVPEPMPAELTDVAPVSVMLRVPLVVAAARVVDPVAEFVRVALPLPVATLSVVDAVTVVLVV